MKQVASLIMLILIIWGIVAFNKSCDESATSSSSVPDKTSAFIIAENFVKASLKAPSTADFGSTFETADAIETVSRSGNSFTVNWHLDAQNSYGAKIRSNYTCRLTYNGGDIDNANNWTCNYLNVDGVDISSNNSTNEQVSATEPPTQNTVNNPDVSIKKYVPVKYSLLQGGVQGTPGWHDVLINKNSGKENIRWVVKQMCSKYGNYIVIDLWTNKNTFIKYNDYLKEQQSEGGAGDSEEYRQLRESNILACYAEGYINYITDGTQEKYP